MVAILVAASAVLSADAQWRDGLLHKDKALLEKVVAPEYTLSTAMGVTPREVWMKMGVLWKTLDLAWRAPPHVDEYGDAAVVRGVLHWHVLKDKPDARTGSADVDQDFLVTDVWIKRAGQWQVVARHSTIPLAKP